MNEDFDSYFEEPDISEVIKRFQDLLQNNKSVFFDLFEFEDIIDYLIEDENLDGAFRAIHMALKSYPFATSIKLRNAKVLIEKGNSNQALQIINEIESVELYNYELHLLKGKVFSRSCKHDDAIREYDMAIRYARENRDEVIYTIAQSFLASGKESVAIKYLLLAHEVNERNLLVLYELASCFDRLEYYDKCIEYLQKFLELDPFAENVWFNLGVAFSHLEKYTDAIDAIDYSLAINPGYFSAYFVKAELYFDLECYSEAIAVYNELLELDNNNLRSLCYIGECYEKLNQADRAIDYFKMAKSLDNSNPEPWFGMAIVYKNIGKLNHSLLNIRKAIKLDGKNAEYWFFLGELYAQMQHTGNSMKAYTRAIEIDPSDYEAWLAYAKLYYEDNKVTDAIEILNQAYQYNYDNSTLNYQLAAYHTTLHEYSVAAKYFEKGLSLNFPEHQDYLCQIKDYFNTDKIQDILSKYQKLK